MDNKTLEEALRAAGHEDQANSLRDSQHVEQLEAAGHSDIAASLRAKLEGKPATPAPTQQQEPTVADRDAAAVVAELSARRIPPFDGPLEAA